MKKIFRFAIYTFILFSLTGCLTIEQRIEKRKIEKEMKKVMVSYLQDSYNIDTIKNINAKYSLGADIATSVFLNEVTAKFEYEGTLYDLSCNYETKKCADGLTYEKIVNPIIINRINQIIDETFKNKIIVQPIVIINNGYENIININDANEISTIEDIAKYYGPKGYNIRYNTNEKIIKNNKFYFQNLINILKKDLNTDFVTIETYYDNSITNEHISAQGEYYSNAMDVIGDYIAVWKTDEIQINNYRKDERGNFQVNIVDNNSHFEQEIELFGKAYQLYSEKILLVKDVSTNQDLHTIYIYPKEKVCSDLEIVSKENREYDILYSSDSFENNMYEEKKYAIYCEKAEK